MKWGQPWPAPIHSVTVQKLVQGFLILLLGVESASTDGARKGPLGSGSLARLLALLLQLLNVGVLAGHCGLCVGLVNPTAWWGALSPPL